MDKFDLMNGQVIMWVMKGFMPVPVKLGAMEDFGEFLDEAIEFYDLHSKKSPVPLAYLKAFYDN